LTAEFISDLQVKADYFIIE